MAVSPEALNSGGCGTSDAGHCQHDFRGHANAAGRVASGDYVAGYGQKRSQRLSLERVPAWRAMTLAVVAEAQAKNPARMRIASAAN